MVSYIRINHFSSSANQATLAPQRLVADPVTLNVNLQNLENSPTAEGVEQNRRTWGIFRQSVIDTIGQHKFDWICHRYRSYINFNQLQESGSPLLPEHVEVCSIGSSQLHTRDIKARLPSSPENPPRKLKTLTREELQACIRECNPFPLVGSYNDPVTIYGSPGLRWAYLFHNRLLMDKEKQLLFSDVERLSWSAWMERLSKVIVNRELFEGQLIPAPGHDGRLDYYKVYRKVAGDGLVSYALKPVTSDSTLKPLIVFRPSQWALGSEDAFETYLNDAQYNVGELGWNANRRDFEQLMNDPHFRRNGERISLAGYSLGGCHEQRFLAEHHANVNNAIFYSDPSIDDETVERFAQTVNALPPLAEPLIIQIFRMKGDFCHYVGGKHIGWGVTHPDVHIQLVNVDHDNKQVAAFSLHAHRMFDNTTFNYQIQRCEDSTQLFEQLDNSKRGPAVFWYKNMHRLWGGVAYVFAYCLSELIKTISWIFGVRILRSSREFEL